MQIGLGVGMRGAGSRQRRPDPCRVALVQPSWAGGCGGEGPRSPGLGKCGLRPVHAHETLPPDTSAVPFAACNLRLSFKKQRGKAVFKMQRFAKSRNVEFGPTTASSGPWQGHHGPRRRGQGGSWRRPHRSHGKPPFLPRLHLWRKLLSGASRSKPGTDGVTERGKAELCLGCFLFSRSHGPPGEPSSPPPTPPRPSVSTV